MYTNLGCIEHFSSVDFSPIWFITWLNNCRRNSLLRWIVNSWGWVQFSMGFLGLTFGPGIFSVLLEALGTYRNWLLTFALVFFLFFIFAPICPIPIIWNWECPFFGYMPGTVTNLLKELNWILLKVRRTILRLTLFHKAINRDGGLAFPDYVMKCRRHSKEL